MQKKLNTNTNLDKYSKSHSNMSEIINTQEAP